ncbi:transcription elongation factor SPT4 [Artemisia annua]|uniref:Transcription elongation factor SPT4 n=1 Tax=Artemisia annua TaxID=35608 RepID=A0A2U1KGA8_ARTAN|nr:transcription elongation factor SPT4 [Artemisia annua]
MVSPNDLKLKFNRTSVGDSFTAKYAHRLLFIIQFCIVAKFAPGCYTLAVSEVLPEDLMGICEEERVPYIPPKRV